MEITQEEINEVEKTVNNDINETEQSFRNEWNRDYGQTINEDKQQDQKTDETHVDNETVEGIPIADLLELCPPDLVHACLSPSQTLAYKKISADLSAAEAAEIKPYFESKPQIIELKKQLLKKVIEKYFPNYRGGTISPVMALLILETLLVTTSVRNAKNHIAEKRFLEGKDDEND